METQYVLHWFDTKARTRKSWDFEYLLSWARGHGLTHFEIVKVSTETIHTEGQS